MHFNVFPINREQVDFKSLKYSLNIFENVESRRLLMFPEGKVVKDKEETGRKYRNGAVFIALHANIPIVPVNITWRPKLFSKVKVIFGKPIYINKEIIKNKGQINEQSKKLIEDIYKLNK